MKYINDFLAKIYTKYYNDYIYNSIMSRIGNMIKQAQNNILKSYTLSLNSSYLLYFILLLTIGDLMYLSMKGDMLAFFTYLIVGYLTSFFSKNMIVILVIAMVVTNIFRLTNVVSSEGMQNEEEEEETAIEDFEEMENEGEGEETAIEDFEEMQKDENAENTDDDNLDDSNMETFTNSMDKTELETAPTSISSAPMSSILSKNMKNTNTNFITPTSSIMSPITTANRPSTGLNTPTSSIIKNDKLNNANVEIQKIKNNLKNIYAPAISTSNYLTPSSSNFLAPSTSNNNINNNELNSAMAKLIGTNKDSPTIMSDKPILSGFDNLDTQTQKLLNTQKELMTNMENLSPLLAQAEKFMEKFQGLAK